MNPPKSIFASSSRPRPLGNLPTDDSGIVEAANCSTAEEKSLVPSNQANCTLNPPTTPRRDPWDHLPAHRQELIVLNIERPLKKDTTLESTLSPPSAAGTKRPLAATGTPAGDNSSETSNKKARVERRPQYTLTPFSFTGPSINNLTPPSPLFFSNSPRSRPVLPPRFSSSEAAAKMLSKTRNEESGIKTVTLARGSFNTGSPPAMRPTPRSRNSVERQSAPRFDSPEGGDGQDQLRLLGQIGITELLDQDDRPTFVIDLGDALNYVGGPLHVIYANTALRSCAGLLDVVSGKVEEQSSNPMAPKSFPQFRNWLLSAAVNGESLEVCLPAFVQGAVTWSCSTLRKRLRIASGSMLAPTPLAESVHKHSYSTSRTEPTGTEIDNKPSEKKDSLVSPPSSHYEEAQDYFGAAVLPMIDRPTAVDDRKLNIMPSIESPQTQQIKPSVPATSNFSAASESTALGQGETSPPVSDAGSFNNACVLSAASASNFDTFGGPQQDIGFFDWTRLPVSENMPPHIQFARTVDWAGTALGPIETWSPDLRQMCNLIMASPHPAAMYWGDDLVAIYNEAYVLLAGQKHPKLMGQSYRVAWAEIWDDVKDVFAGAQMTGQATMKDDDCLFIRRSDFLEETYFSWSIIPLVGGDGSVMGLYNPAFEKTRRKIAERRMLTLREVGERTAAARDVKGFWGEVLAALECNEYDTPFVLLYSIADEMDGDGSSIASSSVSSTKQCHLEGALGVPENHESAPDAIDLKSGMEGFLPVFREVMKNNKPRVLDVTKGELPAKLLEGLESRGFGDPAKAVVVCPIHPTTGESILGFLVMGINPRRPYDDDYSLFIQLLSRQLATSLASVVLFEEEIKRGQRAAKLAALDRIELSEQLAARTQEAIESETKFTRMAEFAPVGMFIADSQGRITYCNDTWYEISRVPKEAQSTEEWMKFVMDEDKALVAQLWYDLVERTKPANSEFRFKAPWVDRNGARGDTWVLFSAYPEKYDDGTLKSVFGSITNISQQKWAEGFQKRKMEEAVELKRQQENFIDITSHEMRNPLSAILQCSDEIVSSLSEARAQNQSRDYNSLFADNIDAAQTIALCAQHQKRIVDDVLTLSKLDSAMLMVTPVDVQPLTVVQRALKMFEGELQNADIQLKFIVDPTFKKLGVDWVRFDPSRVLQVLINLTTNAIKFTTTEDRRTIIVSISASLHKPSVDEKTPVEYIRSRSRRIDMTEGPDWGDGNPIFIHFSVQDTGRGLSSEEKKTLFLRFSQASPRTHVQYGGSGLGLFISRELTELQGGEIGVASEAGQGSTFAFYVKARRSVAPREPVEQLPSFIAGRRASDGKSAVRNPAPPKTRDFASTDDGGARREPLKILIVEDNLVNQRVLQKQLKNIGCITHVANHGGEALDRLRESWFWEGHGPDALELNVVLMDQEMPVMDGLTCTKRIRELQQQGKLLRHVPIIAVTANARNEQIKTAMDAGLDDVVSKPFRIPDLIPKIEELLAKFKTDE